MNDFSFCFRRGFYIGEVQILGRKKLNLLSHLSVALQINCMFVKVYVFACVCVYVCIYRTEINLSVDPLVPFPIR